ncbi:MAG: hypothetical protein M1826_001088 [Phylliscum demangeonii]|nr:MAG: hypothetical protein M1826_001088 [Phylliscum demangeonii]
MSSTSGNRKSVGDLPSSTSTFSYAQAAKGRPTSSQSAAPPPSGTEASGKDTAPTTALEWKTPFHASLGVNDPKPSAAITNGSRDSSLDGSTQRTSGGVTRETSTSRPETHPLSASTHSLPILTGSTTERTIKDTEGSLVHALASDASWDRRSQASSATDRMAGERDGQRDPSRDKSNALMAAPAPPVNVWQQRKEAQAAKAKAAMPSSGPEAIGSRPPVAGAPGSSSGPSGGKRLVDEKALEVSGAEAKRKGKAVHRDAEGGEGGAAEPHGSDAAKDQPRYVAGVRAPEDRKEMAYKTRPVMADPAAASAFKRLPMRQRSAGERDRDGPSAASGALPPVGDVRSWPTPNSARDEEKKKAQGRQDKTEKDRVAAASSKPHGKEKWTPVPYTPTVIFETPLPRPQLSPRKPPVRSSRGARDGARGGTHLSTGSLGGEKGATSAGTFPPSSTAEVLPGRGRSGTDEAKPESSPSKLSKRAASAGPRVGEESHPLTAASASDQAKEAESAGARLPEWRSSAASRRMSTATQTDAPPKHRPLSRQDPRGEPSYAQGGHGHGRGGGGDRANAAAPDHRFHSRSAGPDRRREGSGRHPEQSRDPGAAHHGGQARDRADGRPGRGSYRGPRGGGNGHGHSQPHQSPIFPSGFSAGGGNYPSQGGGRAAYHQYPPHPPAGRPSQPNGNHYGSGPSQQRSHRRDSQSPPGVSSSSAFTRYTGIPGAQQQPLAPIQTQLGPMYEYQAYQTMSAPPYAPFIGQYTVPDLVCRQLEYYFSVDNLCKDLFLRKLMDAQGFVPLSVLANFRRIQSLTQDMELLRYVCHQSQHIEFVPGHDGIDRVRRKEGWEKWLLADQDRDPAAQGEAYVPSHRVASEPRVEMMASHDVGSRHQSLPTLETAHYVDPHQAHHAYYVGLSGASAPFVAATDAPRPSNSPPNGATEATRSATSGPTSEGVRASSVSEVHRAAVRAAGRNGDDAFSNGEMEGLVIVVRYQSGAPKLDHASRRALAPSRTFSNGSIDRKTIADVLGDAPAGFAGRRPNGSGEGSSSHEPTTTPGPTFVGDGPPLPAPQVFWMKDHESPVESVPRGVLHESYTSFRVHALQERETSLDEAPYRDMDVLYQFWSHFLVRNFNTLMYLEFHTLALGDFRYRNSDVGMTNLVQYYDVALNGPKVIADIVARHLVELVEEEESAVPMVLPTLSAAWRNGAMNLKNRKKIEDRISPGLRARLEE